MKEQQAIPYYDAIADKIHGCKKNTYSYYHEVGHQVWGRKGIEQVFQNLQLTIILIALPLFGKLLHSIWIGLFFSIPLGLFLLSEIHAEIYAIIKWLKGEC